MSNHQNDILAEQEWELQQEQDRAYDEQRDAQLSGMDRESEFEGLYGEAEWPSQSEVDR
jgi:hypothetical protein